MDNIYILVSVCDREIAMAVFNSYAEAQKQMHYEMTRFADVNPAVFSVNEYEDDSLGFGEKYAWANGKCDYDWRIFCAK